MKKVFNTISALVLIAAVVGAVYLVQKNQETRKGAASAETSSTILPSTINSEVGSSFVATLMVNTGSANDKLTGAELVVNYDSAKLKYVSLTPQGEYQMVNSLSSVDDGAGKLTIKMITLGNESAEAVSLAKIVFLVQNGGNSNLVAGGKLMITGQGATWVIATNNLSTVTVGGGTNPTAGPTQGSTSTAPTNLAINGSNLTWTPGNSGMPQYVRVGTVKSEVQTGCPGGAGAGKGCLVKSDVLAANLSAYTLTEFMNPATLYYIRVAAADGSGLVYDATIEYTTPIATSPSNLVVSGKTLTWTPSNSGLPQVIRIGADKTEVTTGCPGGSGAGKGCLVKADALDASLGTYTMTESFAPNTKYFIRVASVNSTTGLILDSMIEYVSPNVAVTAPSNLVVDGQTFKWTPGDGNQPQFVRIGTDRTEVSTGCPGGVGEGKGCFFASEVLPGDLSTYVLIPTLAKNTKYFFRVANKNTATNAILDAIIEFTTDEVVGGNGMFKFKTTFAGVTDGAMCASNWKGQVMLMWGDAKTKSFSDVSLVKSSEVSNGLAVFYGEVPMAEVGAKSKLALFVKGPRSIQTKFGKDGQDAFYNQPGGELSWADGAVFDFSKYANLAGDVTGTNDAPDGKVDAQDFSVIKTEVAKRSEGDNMRSDLNGNCKLESQDLSLLMVAMKDKQEQLY